mmetsp:Transcript_704/g.1157  ORF Transcript_704/g.1157 Transcript_704/m.1157 type:complete len:439 (-) Transcript_704:140-1456(-)|eukprot:CAMPEP_0185019842 /NCGR_PEP_ID=MMETSP1103-20130426/2430_1 /TAXON_ID=36769 /ORGANISM="Paraphysomonas bandaiensis, Strain Caron Lab Isolate" /LENGTH=438 /DNA_ID=CAMNT_0027550365 /DNA_START=43 /DNA_END=1359 /DNA_ORIENTATION=-
MTFAMNLLVDSVVSYESEGPSILSYNTDAVLDYGWIIPIRGSIITVRFCVFIITAVLSTTFLAYASCSYREFSDFCVPVPQNDYRHMTMGAVAAFVTVIFISHLIMRWWCIRTHLQGVIGKGNSVIITLAAVFSCTLVNIDPKIEFDARRSQQQIYRYLNLAHALLYKTASKQMDLSDLVERKIISANECAYLSKIKGLNPNIIYGWIQILIQRLAFSGLLGDMLGEGAVTMKTLIDDVENIRSNSSMVLVYIRTQLPYAFVQVVAVVVYAFIIQAIFVSAGVIGLGLKLGQTREVFWGYMTLVLMCFVFIGLLTIYRLLSNPLGSNAADFPKNSYMQMCESGYKKLMLVMHEISTPDIHSPGNVSFKEADLTNWYPHPQRKHVDDKKGKAGTLSYQDRGGAHPPSLTSEHQAYESLHGDEFPIDQPGDIILSNEDRV